MLLFQEKKDDTSQIVKQPIFELPFKDLKEFKSVLNESLNPLQVMFDTIKSNMSIESLVKDFTTMENTVSDLAGKFGGMREFSKEIKASIEGATPSVIALGGTIDDVVNIQEGAIKALNRQVVLDQKAYGDLYAIGGLINDGAENTSALTEKLVGQFKDAGYSVYEVSGKMGDIVKDARDVGVASAAVYEQLSKNMEKLNLYNFSEGVKGMGQMASQAALLRINMSDTLKVADKIFNPEDAIAMAADMQRLGVQVTNLLDPYKLMDMARNNPAELQDSILKAATALTYFDEKNQKISILPGQQGVLRDMAKSLGISNEEMAKMAVNAADMDRKLRVIKFNPFVTEEKDQKFLASLAEMKDGKYQVQMGIDPKTGEAIMKPIENIGSEEIKRLRKAEADKAKSPSELIVESNNILTNIYRSVQAGKGIVTRRIAASSAMETFTGKIGSAVLPGIEGAQASMGIKRDEKGFIDISEIRTNANKISDSFGQALKNVQSMDKITDVFAQLGTDLIKSGKNMIKPLDELADNIDAASARLKKQGTVPEQIKVDREKFKEAYEKIVSSSTKMFDDAKKVITDYITNIFSNQTTPPAPGPNPPAPLPPATGTNPPVPLPAPTGTNQTTTAPNGTNQTTTAPTGTNPPVPLPAPTTQITIPSSLQPQSTPINSIPTNQTLSNIAQTVTPKILPTTIINETDIAYLSEGTERGTKAALGGYENPGTLKVTLYGEKIGLLELMNKNLEANRIKIQTPKETLKPEIKVLKEETPKTVPVENKKTETVKTVVEKVKEKEIPKVELPKTETKTSTTTNITYGDVVNAINKTKTTTEDIPTILSKIGDLTKDLKPTLVSIDKNFPTPEKSLETKKPETETKFVDLSQLTLKTPGIATETKSAEIPDKVSTDIGKTIEKVSNFTNSLNEIERKYFTTKVTIPEISMRTPGITSEIKPVEIPKKESTDLVKTIENVSNFTNKLSEIDKKYFTTKVTIPEISMRTPGIVPETKTTDRPVDKTNDLVKTIEKFSDFKNTLSEIEKNYTTTKVTIPEISMRTPGIVPETKVPTVEKPTIESPKKEIIDLSKTTEMVSTFTNTFKDLEKKYFTTTPILSDVTLKTPGIVPKMPEDKSFIERPKEEKTTLFDRLSSSIEKTMEIVKTVPEKTIESTITKENILSKISELKTPKVETTKMEYPKSLDFSFMSNLLPKPTETKSTEKITNTETTMKEALTDSKKTYEKIESIVKPMASNLTLDLKTYLPKSLSLGVEKSSMDYSNITSGINNMVEQIKKDTKTPLFTKITEPILIPKEKTITQTKIEKPEGVVTTKPKTEEELHKMMFPLLDKTGTLGKLADLVSKDKEKVGGIVPGMKSEERESMINPYLEKLGVFDKVKDLVNNYKENTGGIVPGMKSDMMKEIIPQLEKFGTLGKLVELINREKEKGVIPRTTEVPKVKTDTIVKKDYTETKLKTVSDRIAKTTVVPTTPKSDVTLPKTLIREEAPMKKRESVTDNIHVSVVVKGEFPNDLQPIWNQALRNTQWMENLQRTISASIVEKNALRGTGNYSKPFIT